MNKKHILFEQTRIKQLREFLNLKKIGIHYFCKCCFCNDSGSNLCVYAGAEKYQCYLCPNNGNTDELLKLFGHTHAHTHTHTHTHTNQLRIE